MRSKFASKFDASSEHRSSSSKLQMVTHNLGKAVHLYLKITYIGPGSMCLTSTVVLKKRKCWLWTLVPWQTTNGAESDTAMTDPVWSNVRVTTSLRCDSTRAHWKEIPQMNTYNQSKGQIKSLLLTAFTKERKFFSFPSLVWTVARKR